MSGESHSEIATRLGAQLERLRSADPFRVLDVPPHVDGEGVRHAYLVLTKKLHPNRFALEPASTRDIANELFLLIRRAYDILADDDKRKLWRDRLAPAGPSSPAGPATPAAATPAAPGVGTRPPTSPATSPPASVRPGTPLPVQSPSVRPGTPLPVQSPSVRPGTPLPVQSPPQARATTAVGPAPVARVGVATSPPVTGQPSTSSARASTVPGSPPPATPTRKASGPTTGIGASPQEVQAMLEAARTRGQRFDDAVALLGRGKYKQAREAFTKIAMEDPQGKRYRVQMHLAWGLEHLNDGKPAEAQRELERAVALDPECTDAKTALAKALELQKKSGGILGKLFGR